MSGDPGEATSSAGASSGAGGRFAGGLGGAAALALGLRAGLGVGLGVFVSVMTSLLVWNRCGGGTRTAPTAFRQPQLNPYTLRIGAEIRSWSLLDHQQQISALNLLNAVDRDAGHGTGQRGGD